MLTNDNNTKLVLTTSSIRIITEDYINTVYNNNLFLKLMSGIMNLAWIMDNFEIRNCSSWKAVLFHSNVKSAIVAVYPYQLVQDILFITWRNFDVSINNYPVYVINKPKMFTYITILFPFEILLKQFLCLSVKKE